MVRLRITNISRCSDQCVDEGIAQAIQKSTSYSDFASVVDRPVLKQMFLFLELKKTIDVSRFVILMSGVLNFLRENTVFCDQKQERVFFQPKSAGSYMDCS